MRLKVYRAPGMAEAVARVRAELGVDALILSTRRVPDGVELTAALEPQDTAPAPLPPRAPSCPTPPALPAIYGAASGWADALAWHGVPAGFAARLRGPLEPALAEALSWGTLPLQPGGPPLLLAGGPGAGKTLTVARLATRLVMAGIQPLVITADGRRAGAAEQLAAYTRLLGLTLVVASQPSTLARALARRTGGVPVLIDAPGTDPFDPAQREEQTALAAVAGAVTALVQPAGLDPAEAADQAEAYARAGATLLVATKLDLARRLGSVPAAAAAGRLALTEAGIGPGAADGLAALTPALLAQRLAAHPKMLDAA